MSFLVRPSIGGKGALGGGGGGGGAHVAASFSSNKKKEATFSFPVMPIPEIQECLAAFGINLDEDDILKPKPDVMRNVFEQLIIICMNVTKEELYRPRPLDTDDVLRYEELHDESMPIVHFVRAMNKLLLASGIRDGFNLRDLIKPDPVRTRMYLSGIINFNRYREEKLAPLAAYEEASLARVAELDAVEQEKAMLLEQIQRERDLRAAEQPAIDAANAEIRKLSAEQAEIESAVSKTKLAMEEQRTTINEIKETTKHVDIKIESSKADLEAMKAQIIGSPNRLKAEVEAAAKSLEDARGALARVEQDKKAAACKLDVVTKASKAVTKTTGTLIELEEDIHKLKKITKEVKNKKAAVDAQKTEMSTAESTMEHLERTQKRADEKFAELKQGKFVKEQAGSRATQALRSELNTLNEELGRSKETRRVAEVKKAEIEAEREKAMTKHSAEMSDMLSCLKLVQRTVSDYHVKLFKSLAETSAAKHTGTSSGLRGGASGSSISASGGALFTPTEALSF